MVIEASQILRSPVVDVTGTTHGTVDACVFLANEARLYGLQVTKGNVVTKFRAVRIEDVISINPRHVVIDSTDVLTKDLKDFDQIAKQSGSVLGVSAVTESGKRLGKISDVLMDADTGFIVRMYIRNLLHERIIPRQFLVSITPKQVVFKDIVDTPLFEQTATTEAPSAPPDIIPA